MKYAKRYKQHQNSICNSSFLSNGNLLPFYLSIKLTLVTISQPSQWHPSTILNIKLSLQLNLQSPQLNFVELQQNANSMGYSFSYSIHLIKSTKNMIRYLKINVTAIYRRKNNWPFMTSVPCGQKDLGD